MAGRVEAENDFGALGIFQTDALGCDRNAAVGADFEAGSDAPNIRPPRAFGCGSQHRTLFFFGQLPGALWGLLKFAMGFVGVMVQAQSVDVGVGVLKFGDLFAGEIGWEAPLPELMFAFDFVFGLRGWGIKEANVVELEGRAQLGEGVGGVGEKDGVIIDVELKWAAIGEEGGGEEIEVRQEEFALIDFGAGENAAAIVEHVEHGIINGRLWEPAMGGGVELPDFADLGTLPAANRRRWFFGRSRMGMTVLQSPVADLGAIQFETMEAQGLRGDEAVGTGWRAGQTFHEQVDDRWRPRCSVVAAGSAGRPKVSLFPSTSAEIIGGEKIKLTAGEAELVGRLGSSQGALLKGFKNMANKRVGVPVEQLLVLLITGENTAQRCPNGQSFRQPSLRSGFLKDWPLGRFH